MCASHKLEISIFSDHHHCYSNMSLISALWEAYFFWKGILLSLEQADGKKGNDIVMRASKGTGKHYSKVKVFLNILSPWKLLNTGRSSPRWTEQGVVSLTNLAVPLKRGKRNTSKMKAITTDPAKRECSDDRKQDCSLFVKLCTLECHENDMKSTWKKPCIGIAIYPMLTYNFMKNVFRVMKSLLLRMVSLNISLKVAYFLPQNREKLK